MGGERVPAPKLAGGGGRRTRLCRHKARQRLKMAIHATHASVAFGRILGVSRGGVACVDMCGVGRATVKRGCAVAVCSTTMSARVTTAAAARTALSSTPFGPVHYRVTVAVARTAPPLVHWNAA